MQQSPRWKDQQTRIWKFVTFRDALEVAFITFIAFVFSLGVMVNFSVVYKVITFIVVFIILIPLILVHKKHNAKFYVVLWRRLLFWLSPKKFEKNQEKDTEALVPYSCLMNKHLVKNKMAKSNLLSKYNTDNYFMVFKVNGYNLWNEDDDTQEYLITEFADILDSFSSSFSFVKLETTISYKDNINYIKNLQEKNDFYKEYNKKNIEDFEDLEINKLVDNYYLIINAQDIETLNDQYELILDKTKLSFISVERLENFELLSFLKNLNMYKCSDEAIYDYLNKKNIYNNEGSLDDLFSYEKVTFKADSINIDSKHINVSCLNQLPTNLNKKWIQTIFNSKGTVIWKNLPFDQVKSEKLLNKINNKLSLNALERLEATEEFKNNLASEALNEQIRQITEDQFKIFDVNFYIVASADNEKDLKLTIKSNNNILSKSKIRFNPLTSRQFFALGDVFNYPVTRLDKEFYEITSINLAYGFPFEKEEMNDNKNLLLGFSNKNKNAISFDLFDIKHSNRSNHNMFVLGSSGMGKSTLVMKIIGSLISSNNKAIIIDPQAEYLEFAKKFKGQIIDLSTSSDNLCINPMEVTNKLKNDDDNYDIGSVIQIHIEFLEMFFKTVIDLSERKSQILLLKILGEFYIKEGIYDLKNLEQKNHEEWATISDFIIFMKTYERALKKMDKKKAELLNNVIEEFEAFFEEEGSKYKKLYNGHTNIKIENDLVVFNTRNTQNLTKESSSIAMMMILNLTNEIIFNNWKNNEKIKKQFKEENNIDLLTDRQIDGLINRVTLCIDEEHIYIDTERPEVLKFIVETTKTIRKYDGGTIHTTQNPSDYTANHEISDYARRITDNCNYSVFFGLKSGSDIDAVKEMFKDSKALLKSEINYLTSREKGRILIEFSDNQRLKVNLFYNDLERSLFFKKGSSGITY